MSEPAMTPIKAAAKPSRENLLAQRLETDAKSGCYTLIKTEHDILIAALRLAAAPAGTTPKPFYGAECPAYPACDGGCGLGCTKEIERTHAAPPEASFDNASDMLGYLNAPREAGPVALPTHFASISRAIYRIREWAKNEGPYSEFIKEAAIIERRLEQIALASPSPIPEAPGREEIIEECAKVADNLAAYEGTVFDRADDDGALSETGRHRVQDRAIARQAAADAIARSIRALKPQDGGKCEHGIAKVNCGICVPSKVFSGESGR